MGIVKNILKGVKPILMFALLPKVFIILLFFPFMLMICIVGTFRDIDIVGALPAICFVFWNKIFIFLRKNELDEKSYKKWHDDVSHTNSFMCFFL